MILTVADTAALFQVTERTVVRWIDAGMPVERQGEKGAGNGALIDLKPAVAWYFMENSDKSQLDRERARLARAQADRAEAENRVRAGELVEVNQVIAEVGEMIGAANRRLLAFPSKLCQVVDPNYARTLGPRIREEVHQIIGELRGDYRPGLSAPADRTAVGDSADLDGEPVGGPVPPAVKRKQRRGGSVAN